MSSERTDRERLDELLAEFKSVQVGIPSPPPVRRSKRPGRGLFDLLAVLAAVYTLCVATPVGGLLLRGVNATLGRRTSGRSLIAYFRTGVGRSRRKGRAVPRVKRSRRLPLKATAEKLGVPLALARSVAVVSSDGQRTKKGHFRVRLSPHARGAFDRVGVAWPGPKASASERERRLLEVLAALNDRLGGPEAAVAATVIDIAHVEYAVDRAQVAGRESPAAYQSLRAFLAPDQRLRADPILRSTFALETAFSMAWPVRDSVRVTSPFGMRVHPVLRKERMHAGLDFGVPVNTPVRSVASGEVQVAGRDGVNGRYVKLDHGNGLKSVYCHASELRVARGDAVERGQVILLSGATGRVSGPHLHFQLEIDDRPVDPELFRPEPTPAASGGASRRR